MYSKKKNKKKIKRSSPKVDPHNKFSRFGNTFASSNKRETLEYFLLELQKKSPKMERKKNTIKEIVFVDDSINNVWSVFDYFADKIVNKKLGEEIDDLTITCFWYTPFDDNPDKLLSEVVDATTKLRLQNLAKLVEVIA